MISRIFLEDVVSSVHLVEKQWLEPRDSFHIDPLNVGATWLRR